MSAEMSTGLPVKVISLMNNLKGHEDARRRLTLDTQVIREITRKTCDHPIVILAIAGPARRGKSFMLSYIVRYLTVLEKSKNPGEAGDWMDKSNPRKSMKDKGFHFQNGVQPITEGIWMWSRPFIIPRGQSKVAVLLLDTAGCFDSGSSEAEESALIGLSLLISSCFIFNEMTQINQNTLNTLAKFMQYGQLATQTFDAKCFQRIMFLIRDWNVPTKFDYGAAGGRAFISEYITSTSRITKEAIHNRQSIIDCFEFYDCYLVPHPGDKVLDENFTGSLSEMKEDFQNHVENFVTGIIADAPVKKQGKTPVNGKTLFSLFTTYVDAFNSEEMPSPISILRANIRGLYESKLHQEVVKYESDMESKIVQPFIPEERLLKLHDKYKRNALTNFSKTPNYPTYEKDKVMVCHHLEDELQRRLLKISEKLKDRRKSIVSEGERGGVIIFESTLKEKMGLGFWSRPDFDLLTESAQQVAIEEFLKLCSNPPNQFCEIIIPSFLLKLECIQEKFWEEMEGRRMIAEGQVEGVCESLKLIYLEDFHSNLDEKYASPKSLQMWDSRYVRTALAGFSRDVQQFYFQQSFLTFHHQKFQDDLQAEYHKILEKNEGKLEVIKVQAVENIDQAVTAFNKRAEEILQNLTSTTSAELNQLHTEILSMGLECLEESDLYFVDLSIRRMYKSTLEANLREALQMSLNFIQNCCQLKNDECGKELEVTFQEYCEALTVQLPLEEYLEQSEFDILVTSLVDKMRSDYEQKLTTIGSTEITSFLRQFDEKVDAENTRVANLNNVKREEIESRVERAVRSAKQDYCVQLAQLTDSDQIEKVHSSLAQVAIQKVEECGVQSQSILDHYKENLQVELESELENKKRVWEIRSSQQERALREVMENCQEEYEMNLMCFIQENPFASNKEFDFRQDKIFKEKVGQFQQQVQTMSSNPQQMTRFLDQLKTTLKSKKKLLKETAQINKREANVKVYNLQAQCLSNFVKSLQGLSREEMSPENFEKQSKSLLEQSENNFESNWNFPNGTKKEEILSDLRKKMDKEFKQLRDSQVAQHLYARHMVTSTLSTFCEEIEDNLKNGYIFDIPYLAEELQKLSTKAQENLTRNLTQKKINHLDSIAQFQESLKPKFEILYNQNVANLRQIENQIQTDLEDTRMKSKLGSLKELMDFKEILVSVALVTATEKFKGSDQKSSPILKSLTHLGTVFHTKIMNEVKEKSESKTELILTRAVETYNKEMTKHMKNGPSPTHPDDLLAYNRRSLAVCLREAEKEVLIVTDNQKCVITQRLQNSFRIFQDRNALAGAQSGNFAIGIDLGTTTSCVAVYQDGKAFVIKDSQGRNLTPSYVYFPEIGEPTVGQEAKEFAQDEPESTIFDAKRLIGRKFMDPHVRADILTWPFKVESDKQNNTKIVVRGTKYNPEEISAQVLIHMKKIAENYFKKEVKDAVITVPANFNDSQRDSTRQAAQVAGLNVLQIINEPTAAAISHALSWSDEEKLVLVFDFGGGTFDVSILKTGGVSPIATSGPLRSKSVTPHFDQNDEETSSSSSTSSLFNNECEGGLQVLTTLGDTHLGGEDFDTNMINHCVKEFEKINKVKLMAGNGLTGPNSPEAVKRRLRRLRNECERVKRNLTSSEFAIVSLDAIYLELDLRVGITRTQFEVMNEPLFQKSMDIVKRALDDAQVAPHQLSDVIMVGGSSRIPRVRQLLENLLGNSSININQTIDIQEAVALGASVQACILSGGSTTRKLPRVQDVQPFTLGIKILGGLMSPIILRNSSIPCEKEEPYVTTSTNQEIVDIEIYSGEERMAARNTKLGNFILSGIPPGKAGSQKLTVKMRVDANGILNVTATCLSNGRREHLEISENRGRLTDSQIIRMRQRALGGRF